MAWAVAQLEAQQRAEQEIEDQLNSVAKSFSALLGVAPPTDALAVAPWLAERLSAAEETFEGQRLALENSQVLVQASLARAEANLSVLPEALLGPGGLGLEGLGGKDGEPEGLAFLTLKDELASLRALSDRLERVQRLEVCVPFSAPVDYYNLSSSFGRRKDPFDGSPDWHAGIDLAAWPGTKVRATPRQARLRSPGDARAMEIPYSLITAVACRRFTDILRALPWLKGRPLTSGMKSGWWAAADGRRDLTFIMRFETATSI